jgi:hypothetical protein
MALSDKKLEKLLKILDQVCINELESQSPDQLKSQITSCEQSMKEALDDLEANPKYEELKEGLKALREGLTGVRKRQNAVIQYALHLLEEKGK